MNLAHSREPRRINSLSITGLDDCLALNRVKMDYRIFLVEPKDLSDMFQNTFPGAVVHASRAMCSHIGDLRRGAFVHATQGMLLQMEFFLDVQGPLDRQTFFV